MDAQFRENMTKEEAQQFVRKAISHAMARDGSSGGVIRMVVIDKSGVSTNSEFKLGVPRLARVLEEKHGGPPFDI